MGDTIRIRDLVEKSTAAGGQVDPLVSQPVEVVLGNGDKLVSDVYSNEEGWVGFCISHGECPVGQKIKAGETDNELGAFLRIRTHNPDSLDVIIAACERAKMKLAEAG